MNVVQAGGDPFHKYITQPALDDFKAMFPDDPDVAGITLQQLLNYSASKNPDGSSAEITNRGGNLPRITIDPLAISIAGLIVNLTLFIVGLIGIHAAFKRASLLKTAAALTDNQRYLMQPMIVRAATAFQDERATVGDRAMALFNLAKVFWSAGLITPLLKEFFHSLTIWDAVLYGTLTAATLGAAFISAGAEFVALMVADAFQLGLVGSSLADVVDHLADRVRQPRRRDGGRGDGVGPALNRNPADRSGVRVGR